MAVYLKMPQSPSLCSEVCVPETDSVTVFQCENFRTILGDSNNLICICESLALVTIQAVQPSAVMIHEAWEKCNSSNVSLAGSSYQNVSCTRCQTEVGKVFKNLPPHLSKMSGHISLDVHKISSYEVQQPAPKKNYDEILFKMQQEFFKMQQEISKVQVVLMNLNERFVPIEDALALEAGGTD
uniref:Mis18 domain-containing protein n=1 Tax=Biomphalaria glabrata TaxID=6526 RepID=A0A2C9LSS7_BIOGL